MKIKYNLLKKEKHTNARRGSIETNYGTYDTPMFMPVGTQATVKTLSPEELKECHSGIILANTYHLWLRPGEDVVDHAGGLHKLLILEDFKFFLLLNQKILQKKEFILKVFIMEMNYY